MTTRQPDTLAVLDFGGQYAHLIAKKVRDLGVHTRIFPGDCQASELAGMKGLILSGGPADVNAVDAPHPEEAIFELGIPILGLCYGHQLIAYHLGGKADKGKTREYGKTIMKKAAEDSVILAGMEAEETVWMSHFVTVVEPPPGFRVVGSTEICPIASMENTAKQIFSTQFHIEVTHTPNGMQVFENFINICQVRREWNVASYIPLILQQIKEQVGDRNVFILVSGGVDSTVCFVLLNKALGKERVYGLHVDTGLMRKDESKKVMRALQSIGLDNFHLVDASEEFLQALEGVFDPEEKRKRIGEIFLEVQRQELVKLDMDASHWLLGQGTLYPDTIESGGTELADTIKTHHNRIQQIQDMIEQGLVIEPVADLYKDEVRQVGVELGLPDELVWRHTFPGPGLAVQQLCAKAESYPEDKEAVEQSMRRIVANDKLDVALLPVKSVGVQGDERTYAQVGLLLGQADWYELEQYSTEITNTIPQVNRMVWLVEPADLDIGRMRIKPGSITGERLDLHREADEIANRILVDYNLQRELYEFPIVMIPVSFAGGESIVLRPLYSENVMTVEFAKLPLEIVREMATQIIALDGIDAVFYDVTNKPPATVQWE